MSTTLQAMESHQPSRVSLLTRLPAELRLHILSFTMNERRLFDTTVPHCRAILSVCRQLTHDMYTLLYWNRILSIEISSYRYTKDRNCDERLGGHYIKALDGIPCFDQYGAELGYFIPDTSPGCPHYALSQCPFHRFKEVHFRVSRYDDPSTSVNAWEKINFLVDFFQSSKTKLPCVKVIAVEGDTGLSWRDIEAEKICVGPFALKDASRSPLSMFDMLFQPFRQLEEKAMFTTYLTQDKGYNDGMLSVLPDFPKHALSYDMTISLFSLASEHTLDHLRGDVAGRLRSRRLLNWSSAYVERTVARLRSIPEPNPDDESEDSLSSPKAQFKRKSVGALVERYFGARFFHPLSQYLEATEHGFCIAQARRHSDVLGAEAPPESYRRAGRGPLERIWEDEQFLRYDPDHRIPSVCSIEYRNMLGHARYPQKAEITQNLIELFYSDPDAFIEKLSNVGRQQALEHFEYM